MFCKVESRTCRDHVTSCSLSLAFINEHGFLFPSPFVLSASTVSFSIFVLAMLLFELFYLIGNLSLFTHMPINTRGPRTRGARWSTCPRSGAEESDSGHGSGSSVLRSGSVRFFEPKGGNWQLQPVATVSQLTGTATEPVQPVPIGLVVSKRPV